MLPASSEMRQALKMGRRPCSWVLAIQTLMTTDCMVCAISTPQAPDNQGELTPSVAISTAPPRKPTVASAKQAPQISP